MYAIPQTVGNNGSVWYPGYFTPSSHAQWLRCNKHTQTLTDLHSSESGCMKLFCWICYPTYPNFNPRKNIHCKALGICSEQRIFGNNILRKSFWFFGSSPMVMSSNRNNEIVDTSSWNEFPPKGSGLILRDKMRSIGIQREVGVEPLLLCVQRSQLR